MTDFEKTKPAGLPEPLEATVPRELFLSEVRAWAIRIGVDVKEIHVRPMKLKWASCSSQGRLTFDTDLLRQPADFRRKAIVHELIHLKLPNHGKLFSTLVRAYLDQGVSRVESA